MRVAHGLSSIPEKRQRQKLRDRPKESKGIEQAWRSPERVTVVGHLAGDGIEHRKHRDRSAKEATQEKKQTGNPSNNLRSTHPSNENKLRDRRRARSWLRLKLF
jgi:hypothetical protein